MAMGTAIVHTAMALQAMVVVLLALHRDAIGVVVGAEMNADADDPAAVARNVADTHLDHATRVDTKESLKCSGERDASTHLLPQPLF